MHRVPSWKNVARRHRCWRSRDPLPACLPACLSTYVFCAAIINDVEIACCGSASGKCDSATRPAGMAPVTRFKPFYRRGPCLCDTNSRRQTSAVQLRRADHFSDRAGSIWTGCREKRAFLWHPGRIKNSSRFRDVARAREGIWDKSNRIKQVFIH